MITLLRAVCVSCCFLTGFYYFILFHVTGKNAHRNLWYPVLCLMFGINCLLRMACHPYLLYGTDSSFSISDNLFFITLNLSCLAMTLFNKHNGNDRQKGRHFYASAYCSGLAALLSLAVPEEFALPFYLLSLFLCLVTYIYGFYSSLIIFRTETKTAIFSLVSYGLLTLSLIPDTIFILLGWDVVSIRFIMVPIFLVLHMVMLTMQYSESLNRTRQLSKALSETIEKIGHSSNALKCTQMKPDFLYETLDLIKDKCDADPFTAEDLTIALSKYLRHTLNFQQLKGIVPLTNELELTKAYIAIERERYINIKFVYKLPEEIPEIYVPPLSIQPLIENALVHGFRDFNAEGKITISVIPYQDYCNIDVSDNGQGIPEEMLSGLPASFAQTAHIGLYNISKRLTDIFGKGLVIQSVAGVGTSISFTVPPEGKYDSFAKEVQA